MNVESSQIKCPNCGHGIDVNEILYQQLDTQLREKYNADLAAEKQKYGAMEKQITEAQVRFEEERSRYLEKLNAGISQGVAKARDKLEEELTAKIQAEQEKRIDALQSELNAKSVQVKELNRSKAEIEKLKREKSELRGVVELEAQRELNRQLTEEREKIRKAEASKIELRLSEKEHVINQLREQLQEAHRKAEQGSMQTQGEVQELAIEEWLQSQFPFDTIDEIKKGARGADCLQTVNTRSRQACGTIYYESKRTKNFSPIWIEKFKGDIRERNADIGVLVTSVLPSGMDRMGLYEGVWICTYDEFKGLSAVLRESLVKLSNAVSSQENKGDKMNMLYGFLTGNEFRLQVEAIVEGFTQMHADLDSERRAMQSIWKKREKQIEKVLLNTNHMYSSIKGIAGSAIQSVPLLEMDQGGDDSLE